MRISKDTESAKAWASWRFVKIIRPNVIVPSSSRKVSAAMPPGSCVTELSGSRPGSSPLTTFTVTVTECDNVPLAPVTVRVYVPTGVCSLTKILRRLLAVPLIARINWRGARKALRPF